MSHPQRVRGRFHASWQQWAALAIVAVAFVLVALLNLGSPWLVAHLDNWLWSPQWVAFIGLVGGGTWFVIEQLYK